MSAFTISNRLNSPTSSNTPSFVADTASTGYKFCCCILYKAVQLENNSKALDIRLTANIRSTSEVEMYFRTSRPDDDRQIEDLSWTFSIQMVVQMYQSYLPKTILHLKNINLRQVILMTLHHFN